MVTLRTERLTLRPWQDADLEPFAAINADRDVMEHLDGPYTRAQSDSVAARIRRDADERGFGLWALDLAGGPPFIGFAGLAVPSFGTPHLPAVEIGWRLARAHWGRGLATEAAVAALRHAFETLAVDQVGAFTVPANRRSIAVMERLGMTRVAGGDFDHPALPEGHRLRRHVLYRLRRTEWLRVAR